jgi:hypothetical protein
MMFSRMWVGMPEQESAHDGQTTKSPVGKHRTGQSRGKTVRKLEAKLGDQFQCRIQRTLLDDGTLAKPGGIQTVFRTARTTLVVDVLGHGIE